MRERGGKGLGEHNDFAQIYEGAVPPRPPPPTKSKLRQVAVRSTQNLRKTSTEKTQSLAGEGIVRTHTASTGMISGPQLGMRSVSIILPLV